MSLARALALSAVIGSGACATHASPLSSPNAPVAGSPAHRQLQQDLMTIFNAPVMARGVWGIDVRLAETGEVLYQLNAERLMMPASNMKILTLAAAAERLGWEHRFATTLESSAPIENGVLRGDLVVRGTGDPTISTRGKRSEAVLDELAASLRAHGITSIAGRIVGDDQAFDDDGLGPGWSWDYLEAGYAAPIGPLQFNENTADLTASPGGAEGDPVILRMTPGSGLTLVNHARTALPVEGGGRGGINIRRRIDRPEVEVRGTLAPGAQPVSRTVAVLNPTLYFAQALKDGLIARGLTVDGDAVDGDDVASELLRDGVGERKVLATAQSPPLHEIGSTLMKVSQNQYAETLLKAVGASVAGLGTIDAGRDAAVETFTSWNVPRDSYVLSDGSGLSRYNYVAPTAVTTILRRMYSDPKHRDRFIATLPIAGKDGTISTRMRRTRAAGNAVAKTGSIANVRSLSGFVRTQSGDMVVFAILANDFVIPAATVNWIADLAVETIANFKR